MDQEVPDMGEGEMWEGEGCEVWKGRRERPHVLSSEIASFPYSDGVCEE